MRILVTGGCGFIGGHLVTCLLEEGHDVLNIDKLTYAADPSRNHNYKKGGKYRALVLDICDREGVFEAFNNFEPEVVVHLAAESHVDRSIKDPEIFLAVNVIGTYNLISSALAIWQKNPALRSNPNVKFIHVSTDEVYGSLNADDNPFTEQSPYNPSSPYSASKASSDHLVSAWGKTFGLPYILTNCSNNFGPFQFPEKLIPVVVTRALELERIPIYGSGENIRDWIYVKDHAKILSKLVSHSDTGVRYNIGGGNEIRNVDLASQICMILDQLSPRPDGVSYLTQIEYVCDRPGHDNRYAIDSSKIQSTFPDIKMHKWSSALLETIQWYIDNTSWKVNKIPNPICSI